MVESDASDTLSDLFDAIEIASTQFMVVTMRGQQGISESRGPALFWSVTQGSLHVAFEDGQSFDLRPGDGLLAINPIPHLILSEPGVTPTPIRELFAARGWQRWHSGLQTRRPYVINMGENGEVTKWLGAMVEFGSPERSAIVANLPPYLYLPAERSLVTPWLDRALAEIVAGIDQRPMGYTAMANRVAELVVLSCIRGYLATSEAGQDWLSSLTDPRIARALASIHAAPHEKWTVERMAAEASLSRSVFSARFTEIVGESPMEHLTSWRMRIASEWLNAGTHSIKAAAHALGYNSAASFSVAFKRKFGVPPASSRRTRE